MTAAGDAAALLSTLYEAASGSAPWERALAAIADAVGAKSALLFTPTQPPETGLFVAHNLDPAVFATYAGYYHAKDLWFAAGERLGASAGTVLTGDALVDRGTFKRSEWYADFLRPMEIAHLLGTIVAADDHPLLPRIHISLFREDRRAAFGDADRATLAWLYPHLQRAMTIRFRLGACQSSNDALAGLIETLSTAVVLVAADGRVSLSNRAAAAIFRAGDGLSLDTAGIRAASRHEHEILQQIVKGAGPGAHTLTHGSPSACTVSRPSGRRPYQLIAVPLSTPTPAGKAQALAIAVFIVDPEQRGEIDAVRIARLLGLTGAEARLCAALAAGLSLAEYAGRAGISLGTARWTLKQTLAKTGSDRQSSLVAMVVRAGIARGSAMGREAAGQVPPPRR